MTQRVLIRARGQAAPINYSPEFRQKIREARSKLTEAQLDRYYRAARVWFHPETQDFSFQDGEN